MLSKKNLVELSHIMTVLQQNNDSGINTLDTLRFYEENCTRREVKDILAAIRTDINKGISIPDAFAKHPSLFPPSVVEMMRVNEETGQSEAVYKNIVAALEQDLDLRRHLGSLGFQILFIGTLLIGAFIFLLFWLSPMIAQLVGSLHIEVPFITRMILAIGDFLRNHLILLLVCCMFFILGTRYFIAAFPVQYQKLLLDIPIYSKLISLQLQYRFLLVFGLCKSAGLDTVKALQLTRDAGDNALMAVVINKALTHIQKFGLLLSESIMKADTEKVFDNSVYLFLKAGEQSDLAILLKIRAESTKKDLIKASNDFVNNLSNFLYIPIGMILIGLYFSIWLPMLSIMSSAMTKGGF